MPIPSPNIRVRVRRHAYSTGQLGYEVGFRVGTDIFIYRGADSEWQNMQGSGIATRVSDLALIEWLRKKQEEVC